MCLFWLSFALNLVAVSVSDNSGWDTGDSEFELENGPCNIDVVTSLTREEFLSRYAFTSPVVLKSITDNSVFQERCKKDALLSSHGDKVITLSTANTYSYRKKSATLAQYIENILEPQNLNVLGNSTLYWFGDNNYTEWESFFDLYKPPPFGLPGKTGAYSFGLAGPGTGVPFHFHGPGFAEVIYGRKRWFLYPPHQRPDFDGDETTLHWLLHDYPNLAEDKKPLECTIGPGEAIYFPDHWWHATLNLENSVFISTFLS